jgi:predicted secreted protein
MRGVVLSGVFSITWFLALFVLLPVGVAGEGSATIRIGWKFAVATAAAVLALGVFYGLIQLRMLHI